LREGYGAFASGDLATVQRLFHPGIIWHAQRLGQLGGDHVGWPAVAEFFGLSMELTRGTFRVELLDVLTNATGGAAVVRSSGERDGKRLDDRQVHLYQFESGQVVEVWQFVGDGHAAEDFWA
jgi:ketosteroid isomerase-like protein